MVDANFLFIHRSHTKTGYPHISFFFGGRRRGDGLVPPSVAASPPTLMAPPQSIARWHQVYFLVAKTPEDSVSLGFLFPSLPNVPANSCGRRRSSSSRQLLLSSVSSLEPTLYDDGRCGCRLLLVPTWCRLSEPRRAKSASTTTRKSNCSLAIDSPLGSIATGCANRC